MLCQRERSPLRSRPRKCAISCSRDICSRGDRCDVSAASHQAACLARSKAADEALLSLMRYTRPLSVCSETRLRPSFLRTTPARKPRTECCCQSVAAMIAAIVAPAGVRSIAMMRACLVLGRVGDLDAASTDCSRDLGLLAFRAGKRAAAFGLDLGLVMGSSEVHAAPSAAPPQTRLGQTPGRARSRGEPQSPQVTTATLRSDKKASQF